MPEEYKLHADTTRALKAKELLENELLIEAFKVMREGYLQQLKATSYLETPIRETCWLALRAVDIVEAHLTKIISDGELAKSDLKDLAQVTERKKRFGIV